MGYSVQVENEMNSLSEQILQSLPPASPSAKPSIADTAGESSPATS